jgi:hypothetical protein
MQRRIVLLGIAMTPVVLGIVLLLIRQFGNLPDGGILEVTAAEWPLMPIGVGGVVLAILCLAASFAVRMFAGGDAPITMERGRRARALAMSVAHAGAIFGLLLGLLTGQFVWASVMIIIAFVGAMVHIP